MTQGNIMMTSMAANPSESHENTENERSKGGSAQESDRRLNSCGNPESDQFGFGSHHSLGFEE